MSDAVSRRAPRLGCSAAQVVPAAARRARPRVNAPMAASPPSIKA
jgi:hypothetical protein